VHSLDEHRGLVESYLADLAFDETLNGLTASMRYALEGGGKRIRPVLCLATGEAAGAHPQELLPAAAAVELVHTFSLVHDDLPALDDDAVRRGRASTHVEHGEATAILAGDALLAQALALALTYPDGAVARELVGATLGMIGGQYLDVADGSVELQRLHELKTGQLFRAAVGSALWVAGVAEPDQRPWRAFARDFGLLFQLVDDVIDGDGVVAEHGEERSRALVAETEARARGSLGTIDADTSRLDELVSGLSTRARAS
jgi:geranylgeranyl diphosphate synthase, type II